MLDCLKTLCELPGVSSFEDRVRAEIRRQVEPYADEIRQDVNGNLLVFKRGRKPAQKTLLLAAHMDEVGLMIRSITEDGYLKFDFVGGVDRRVTIGKRILVGEQALPGVIGLKAYHLVSREEEKSVPKTSEFYIDIGCTKKEEAEALVSLGDFGVFDCGLESFGQGMVKAKALDDRLGCALLIRMIQETPPLDSWFAFTVQEEVGTRGALGAAFALEPDFALVVEGTTAADLPDLPESKRVCALGKGAVLPAMDRGTVYDRAMFEGLRAYAEAHRIPWQLKAFVSGGTDAAAIQRSRSGVRVATVAAPVRYIHAPASVICEQDLEAVWELMKGFYALMEEWNG